MYDTNGNKLKYPDEETILIENNAFITKLDVGMHDKCFYIFYPILIKKYHAHFVIFNLFDIFNKVESN